MRYHKTPIAPITYCYAKSKKDVKQICNDFELDRSLVDDCQHSGHVQFFSKDGKTLAIMRTNVHGEPIHEIAGLIAHEATHIKQEMMDWMNENKPSIEFEAYVIQEITTNLLNDYLVRHAAK